MQAHELLARDLCFQIEEHLYDGDGEHEPLHHITDRGIDSALVSATDDDSLTEILETAINQGLTPEAAVKFLLDDVVLARCHPFELGKAGVTKVLTAVHSVAPLNDRSHVELHTELLRRLTGYELDDDALMFDPPVPPNVVPGGYFTSRRGLYSVNEYHKTRVPEWCKGEEEDLWQAHMADGILDALLDGPPMHPGLLGWVWFSKQHESEPDPRAVERLAEQWKDQTITLESFEPGELRWWIRHLMRWMDVLEEEYEEPLEELMYGVVDAHCEAELKAGHPNPFDYDAAPDRMITPVGWYDSSDGLQITPNGEAYQGRHPERSLFHAPPCVWPPLTVFGLTEEDWRSPYTSIGKWLSMRNPPHAMLDVGAWHPEHAATVLRHTNAGSEHRQIAQMMLDVGAKGLKEPETHERPVRCNRLVHRVYKEENFRGDYTPFARWKGSKATDRHPHPANVETAHSQHPCSGELWRCRNKTRVTYYNGWCGRCVYWLSEFAADTAAHGSLRDDISLYQVLGRLASPDRVESGEFAHHDVRSWNDQMGSLDTLEFAAVRRWMSVDELRKRSGRDTEPMDGASTVSLSLPLLQDSVSGLRRHLDDGFTDNIQSSHLQPGALLNRLVWSIGNDMWDQYGYVDDQASHALEHLKCWVGHHRHQIPEPIEGAVATPPGCVVNGSSITYYPEDDTDAANQGVCATNFTASTEEMHTVCREHDTALLLTTQHLDNLDGTDVELTVRSVPTGTNGKHPVATVTGDTDLGRSSTHQSVGQATIIPKRAPVHPHRFSELGFLDDHTGHVTMPATAPATGGVMALHVPTVAESLHEHRRVTSPSFEHNFAVDHRQGGDLLEKSHEPVVVFQPAVDGESSRLTFSTWGTIVTAPHRLMNHRRDAAGDADTVAGVVAAASGHAGAGVPSAQSPRPVVLPADYLLAALEKARQHGSDMLHLAWHDGRQPAGTRSADEPVNMPLVHFDCDPAGERSQLGVTVAAAMLPGPTEERRGRSRLEQQPRWEELLED